MTRMKTARIGIAVLGMTTLMAQGAFAMDDDMTCGDFMKMNEADQTAFVGNMAGPDAKLESGADDAVQVQTDGDASEVDGSGGLENANEAARGTDEEMMTRIVENCSSDMDRMVSEAANRPGEKTGD